MIVNEIFSSFQILLLAFAIGVSPAAIRPPGNDLQAPLGNQVRTYKTHQDPSSDSIVRFENTSDVDGSYHYAYETSQGTKVEEQGVQKLVADNQQASHVTGGYSYSDPDGAEISLTYVADENGFQPKVSRALE